MKYILYSDLSLNLDFEGCHTQLKGLKLPERETNMRKFIMSKTHRAKVLESVNLNPKQLYSLAIMAKKANDYSG